jgi:hypothetical protein
MMADAQGKCTITFFSHSEDENEPIKKYSTKDCLRNLQQKKRAALSPDLA